MKPIVVVAELSAEGSPTISVAGETLPAVYASGGWQSFVRQWPSDAIQAVVLLASDVEASEYPCTETLLPYPVVSMPRLLSLAAFAPEDWPRFAVLDSNDIGRCGLVTRAGANRFYFAETRAADDGRAAQAFGYERAVAGGNIAAKGFAELRHVLRDDRVAAGAERLAVSALRSHGACSSEEDSRAVLRLACRHSAAYNVIHTPSAAFDPAEDSIAQLAGGRPVLLSVDRHVMDLYGRAIVDYAQARLLCCGVTTVEPGDASKVWAQVAQVCDAMQRAGLPRHGIVVGVGGGVTLDVSGMAASLYRRGVGYIRVPTTLMAMVDVAVGIKHAINFGGRKSLLGTFHPPLGVVNDFTFLKTLPESELANGMSEIVKLVWCATAHYLNGWSSTGTGCCGAVFSSPTNGRAGSHCGLNLS